MADLLVQRVEHVVDIGIIEFDALNYVRAILICLTGISQCAQKSC